jgi:hypothetical protein
MQLNFGSFVILIAILSALLGAIIGKIDRDKTLEPKSYSQPLNSENQKSIE